MRTVPLSYSGLSASLFAHRRVGSTHTSEPLLPSLALREWGLYALCGVALPD
jgi:hypothetical protein